MLRPRIVQAEFGVPPDVRRLFARMTGRERAPARSQPGRRAEASPEARELLELAERKAYTSALVGIRTADLVPLVQPGAELYPLLAVSGGRYSAMGGGVPLTHDGQLIAGIGVSGGTTEQDIAIVEAAMT